MKERGFTTFWRVAKYWLLFIATVLLLYLRFIHGHPFILELCIYLALLLFIVMQKPMMATLKALSPPYRVFLIILMMLLLGTQLVNRDNETFPFVGWSMYTRPAHGNLQYYDYTMVSQSEQEVRPEVFGLSRSLSYRLMFPLKSMAYNIDQALEGWRRQAMIAAYETALQAIARLYNHRHDDDPIRTIRVWHCTIPLHEYRDASSVQHRLFWQLQVQE